MQDTSDMSQGSGQKKEKAEEYRETIGKPCFHAMQRLSGFEINSRSLYGIWGGISSLFAEKLAMSWQNSNLFPPRTYI